ncbi:hypothetical protein [Kiloniella sp. EL199]|uniref:hypothetical protein n=1 Tax=Kiloniella sp. EL199 TaxID=2107581 RepID=UPI000EA379E7|nr:hypothetical protein [Kiloniella sp. EL199]
MSKEKYQITRKSDFLCLTILLHDLRCFDEELSEPIENTDTLLHKMRYTRNVFVSLHNLKDTIKRIRIDGDTQFTSKTRSIKQDLNFIVHIRNKGVGHLDRPLMERAAQWVPELFHENTHENDNSLTLLSYKAMLESTINSYLNEEGQQKVFGTEIDFFYPPDAEIFFEFLSDIVKRSITWLEYAREIIRSEIDLHSDDKIQEMGAISGKTNFNLKVESDFTFSEEEMVESIMSAIDKMRKLGVEAKVIEFLESKVLK